MQNIPVLTSSSYICTKYVLFVSFFVDLFKPSINTEKYFKGLTILIMYFVSLCGVISISVPKPEFLENQDTKIVLNNMLFFYVYS